MNATSGKGLVLRPGDVDDEDMQVISKCCLNATHTAPGTHRNGCRVMYDAKVALWIGSQTH